MDAFHTLSEIAVAITGFSSLVIVLRGSSADWSRQEYLGLGYVLGWSVGAIFLSLLPVILGQFDIGLATAARIGLSVLPVYMLAVGWTLGAVRRRFGREAGAQGQAIWRSAIGPGRVGKAMSTSALFIVVICIAAAVRLLPGPAHGWYSVAIVLLMTHAVAEMGVFVLLSSTEHPT